MWLLDSNMYVTLTLTLLHFVWFACLVALATAVTSWLLWRSSSQVRYVVHVAALLIMVSSMPIIYALVQGTPPGLPHEAQLVNSPRGMSNATDDSAFVDLPPVPAELSEGKVHRTDPDSIHVAASSLHDQRPSILGRTPRKLTLDAVAPFVICTYVVGVLFMFARLAMALWGGLRLRRAARMVRDAEILATAMQQAKRIGLRVVPLIGWCDRIAVPVVVGLIRPVILLPATLATGLDAIQLELLLAHEMAHVRRLDLLVNLVQRLVEATLFFHPAVWYVSRCVSRERENACDDLVLSVGCARDVYVESLLRVAELCQRPHPNLLVSQGLLAAAGNSPSQLKLRILRLLGHDPVSPFVMTPGGVMGLVLAIAMALITPFVVRTFANHASPAEPEADVSTDSQETGKDEGTKKANPTDPPPQAIAQKAVTPRQIAERAAKLLGERKYEEFVHALTPELASELTAEKLAQSWSSLTETAGEFQRFRRFEFQRLGDRQVLDQSARWQNSELTVGFLLDDTGHIAGFRLLDAPRRGKIPVTVLPAGGWRFGAELRRLSDATGSIKLTIHDPAGVETDSAGANLWREFTATPDAPAAANSGLWTPDDGTSWKSLESVGTGRSLQFENLPAGRYRISARQSGAAGLRSGVSAVIQLTSDRSTVESIVRLQEGGRFEFQFVDDTNRTRVDNTWCSIDRAGHDWPYANYPPKYDPQTHTWTVTGLPPGNYQVKAGRRPTTSEDRIYELADQAVVEAPVPGEVLQREFALRARPMTEKELLQRWPWMVEGTVRDESGRPLAGITLRASAGWGTLGTTGSTQTDANGNYRLRFGRGMMFEHEDPDELDVQAAVIFADLPGHYDQTLCRQGEFLAANRMPTPKELESWVGSSLANRILVEGQPQRLDFIMAPTSTWKVQLVDDKNQPLADWRVAVKGDVLPPASSVLESGSTDPSGTMTFQKIPVKYNWRIEVTAPNSRESQISPLVRFPTAGEYQCVLQKSVHEATGLNVLKFTSMVDTSGADHSAALLVPDPRTAPPVSTELQTEARQILRQVGDVNHDWLLSPPDSITRYSYRFHSTGQTGRRIEVDPRSAKNWTDTRGTAYIPAVGILVSLPDQLVFRQVERRDGQILLAYVAGPKAPAMRMHYGIGVAGKYGPFTSSGFFEGELKINAQTHAVIEHSTGELHEEFLDYATTRDGHLAPMRIRISKNSVLLHDWRFRVHPSGLWLLDQALDGKGIRVAHVDEVEVAKREDAKRKDGARQSTDPVPDALRRASQFLERQQAAATPAISETWQDGLTALCIVAQLRSDHGASSDSVKRALEHLAGVKPERTYTVALQTIAFCAADAARYDALIRRNVDWLVARQASDGEGRGGWSYGPERSLRSDGSNTRYALWALTEAHNSGIPIPASTWKNATEYWLRSQHVDGMWSYQPTPSQNGSVSMTLAGIECLAVLRNRLDDSDLERQTRAAMDRAWQWFDANGAQSPLTNSITWRYHAIHSLSRAIKYSGGPNSDQKQWRLLESRLIDLQDSEQGSWTSSAATSNAESPMIATSLAMLSLAILSDNDE